MNSAWSKYKGSMEPWDEKDYQCSTAEAHRTCADLMRSALRKGRVPPESRPHCEMSIKIHDAKS